MKFILNKDKLTVEGAQNINSGSTSYYEVEVEHDDSWADLNIEAIMVKLGKNVGKSTAVINNKMYVDQTMEGTYSIGFVGYKIVGEVKTYQISTNLMLIDVNKGAGEIITKNEALPTPTEWEIYNAQIQELIRESQAIVNEANNLNVELENNILTITKKDGTQHSENIKGDKGEKGDAGSVKFIIANELPTENIDDSAIYMVPAGTTTEGNTYEEYIYVNGQWESLGSANVNVDLTDYVKNTDIATGNKLGLVMPNVNFGIGVNANGNLIISPAIKAQIEAKLLDVKPITPKYLDYAIKVGLSNNQEEWTEEEKASARNLLGGHVTLTQAEYDALVEAGTVDENTFYYIKEE